ncbi:3D domain-containing protein [Deinococcus taklimakanensis]|uniref:3D domain-containing protein n=1 Tax=Deinococcus taklimakanensis TaxID=536443 RepID=A0ABW5P531_9DEIO
MTRTLFRRIASLLLLSATASATPALPTASLATEAVREALSAPALTASAPQTATPAQAAQAEQTRAAAVAQAVSAPVAVTRSAGRTAIVRATAYNSLSAQTDSTPNITATGTRTRPGVVALSRDLLRTFPYGTRIRIEDLSGRYNFGNQIFTVEDTMAARKVNSLDIWMSTRSQAISFGARQVRITAVR